MAHSSPQRRQRPDGASGPGAWHPIHPSKRRPTLSRHHSAVVLVHVRDQIFDHEILVPRLRIRNAVDVPALTGIRRHDDQFLCGLFDKPRTRRENRMVLAASMREVQNRVSLLGPWVGRRQEDGDRNRFTKRCAWDLDNRGRETGRGIRLTGRADLN
jgi:hypothetical protein